MAMSQDRDLADQIAAKQRQAEQERKAREEAELRAKAQQMQEEQRKRLEEAKERIRARGTTPPQAAAPVPAPAARIYEVKPGDTLAKIAKQFYGDANRWHEIHEANRDAIPNPDLIQVGQKIRIP
jgi:nucleoid-associated protein YgaU